MKRIRVGLGALGLVLLLVALVVPWLIPAGVYKDRFVAEIAAATGRPVRIDGTFGFSVLPNLSLVATELTRGPWDPDAQHAGPPAALIAREVESLPSDEPRIVGRLTYEILPPVPIGRLTRKQRTSLAPPARTRSPAWAPCAGLPMAAPLSVVPPATMTAPVKRAQPPPASSARTSSVSWLPSAFVATVVIA